MKKILRISIKLVLIVCTFVIFFYFGNKIDSRNLEISLNNGDVIHTGLVQSAVNTSVADLLNSELLDLYSANREDLKAVGLTDKSADILLPAVFYRPVNIKKLGLSDGQLSIALKRLKY